MKIISHPPDVDPKKWYDATTSIRKLGMTRTTFWRKACAGIIRRKFFPTENKFKYQGKELTRIYYLFG